MWAGYAFPLYLFRFTGGLKQGLISERELHWKGREEIEEIPNWICCLYDVNHAPKWFTDVQSIYISGLVALIATNYSEDSHNALPPWESDSFDKVSPRY
jgi:hypothetical protein